MKIFTRMLKNCLLCPELHFTIPVEERGLLVPLDEEWIILPYCCAMKKEIPDITIFPEWCPLPEVSE